MFEETVLVFCTYLCNHVIYVLLSNVKYFMTRISTDEPASSGTVSIILPMTKYDVIIYRIFNQ